MRIQIYVHRFVCKNCGKESKTVQSIPSFKSILKGAKSIINLKCGSCHTTNDYHVNRIYRNLNPLFAGLFVVAVFLSSYFFGNYMLREYWRDDYRVVNDSLTVIFFSYSLPLVLGLFTLTRLARPKGTLPD